MAPPTKSVTVCCIDLHAVPALQVQGTDLKETTLQVGGKVPHLSSKRQLCTLCC